MKRSNVPNRGTAGNTVMYSLITSRAGLPFRDSLSFEENVSRIETRRVGSSEVLKSPGSADAGICYILRKRQVNEVSNV